MKKITRKKEYCQYCGRLMEERTPKCANNFGYETRKFDEKTGRKIMRRWIACPMYNPLFGISHTAHAIGEPYLEK